MTLKFYRAIAGINKKSFTKNPSKYIRNANRTLRRLIKKDLELKFFAVWTFHLITEAQKLIRLKKEIRMQVWTSFKRTITVT